MIYKIPIITVEKTWNTALVPIEADSLDEAIMELNNDQEYLYEAEGWKVTNSETLDWEIDEEQLKQETVE